MISVLIPVYNRQKYIVPCIESLLNQTYKDFQILIYNDGSKDNTKFMIETVKDKRIKYFESNFNNGVAYARNRLLELCDTEIACWQDSDDLSNKYRLKNQVEMINTHYKNNRINSVFFRDVKEINIDENITDNLKYEFPFASLMFWTKDVQKFDETLKVGEDVDWINRLAYKPINLFNIGYYVRFHADRLGVKK